MTWGYTESYKQILEQENGGNSVSDSWTVICLGGKMNTEKTNKLIPM